MKWLDIETRNVVTEEQLRKDFEALKAWQPEEYSYGFDEYVRNCQARHNGTLIPLKNEGLTWIIEDAIKCSDSPIVKLQNGKETITFNLDEYAIDYSLDDVVRLIIQNMDDNTAVFIDGTNIVNW